MAINFAKASILFTIYSPPTDHLPIFNTPMAGKKPKPKNNTIAQNKRARHDYFISDKVEAGIALQGWEV